MNLMNYFQQCYFTTLSCKDQIQSRQQALIVQSIRRIVLKKNLIIRVTDKSNNFSLKQMLPYSYRTIHSMIF